MKRSRISGILIAAFALFSASSFALAAGHPGARLVILRRAFMSLDLSDNQKAEIRAIFEKAKPELDLLGAQLKTDAESLKALMEGPAPDHAAVGKAMLKVRSDRQALQAEFGKTLAAARDLLTPEQQAKLDGYLAAWKKRPQG